MELGCKRCGYKWGTKLDKKPSVCPRCKSKYWHEHKTRSWEKDGYLYVVMIPSGIKVGQTQDVARRLRSYGKIIDSFYTTVPDNLNKNENKLIKYTESIAKKHSGREYFIGGSEEFGKIKDFIQHNWGSFQYTPTTERESEFDYLKFACDCAVENSAQWLAYIMESRKNEREQFFLSVNEAYSDFMNGTCSCEKALESLMYIANDMLDGAKKDIADKKGCGYIDEIHSAIEDMRSE